MFGQPNVDAATPDPVSPAAQGPLNYAAAALAIAKLDTEAIVRVSRDPMALVIGAVVSLIVSAVSIVARSIFSGATLPIAAVVVGPIIGLVVSAVTTGAVHVLAKVMFQANGTLVGLLRVLWLGSFVSLVAVIPIPILGALVAGIWSLLITMVTFQEVDAIERLQALGLSIVVSLGFGALLGALTRMLVP